MNEPVTLNILAYYQKHLHFHIYIRSSQSCIFAYVAPWNLTLMETCIEFDLIIHFQSCYLVVHFLFDYLSLYPDSLLKL